MLSVASGLFNLYSRDAYFQSPSITEQLRTLLLQKRFLIIDAVGALVALPLEAGILASRQAAALAMAIALMTAILLASARVAHHAEEPEKVGEPSGTMVRTLIAGRL